MPFLGSTPAEQYKSLAKQTITGDGNTQYTLNQTPTSAYEIEVFINNVRQEPDTSYTVTGNQINFTEAVTASDSCYIIFQGKSVGTINPPANSVGSNEITTDAVGSDELAALSVTHGHLHTDTLNPITLDQTNNRVGIGTTTPSSPLHIQADNIGLRLDGSANTSRKIFFRNTTTSNPAEIYSDGTLKLWTEDSNTEIRLEPENSGICTKPFYVNTSAATVRPLPTIVQIVRPTINQGGYSASWTRLGTFGSSGHAEVQFQIIHQGDHNYSRAARMFGQCHQWSGSTGNYNYQYWTTQSPTVSFYFKHTSSRELWMRISGEWSYTTTMIIDTYHNFTIDGATYQANQSPPSSTTRTLSGTTRIDGEYAWGA